MNEITSINPDDARLTRQLVYESQAATAAYESTRIRNICLGTGAVVLAAGIGLAALVWAWNQGVDPEALKQALADMPPIKVETTLKDGEVTLKDGGLVSIRDGGKVSVDGTVRLDTSSMPDIAKLLKPAAGGDTAIKREVTVFNEAPFENGTSIVTGWNYANGSAEKPKAQFCYVSVPKADMISSDRIDIARDGKPFELARAKVPSFDAALNKCIWFDRAK